MYAKLKKVFLLVHSPLVGPYTWEPVAEELRNKGNEAIVPSLLDALQHSHDYSQEIAKAVAEKVEEVNSSGPFYLVAHSAAGAYLPVIRKALDHPVAGYVFVDARLPEDQVTLFGDFSASAKEQLLGLAQDGFLPPWSKWYEEEAMREVIPDERMRKLFLEELRPLPINMFEEKIPVFSGWPDAPCGYLRLSEFYKPLAQRARSLSWPVIDIEAEHLHMLVAPEIVMDAILQLTNRLESAAFH